MKPLRPYRLAIVFTLLSFAVAAGFYGRLPAVMPIHWDAHGHINGWARRPFGAFLIPVIGAVITALLIAVALLPSLGRSIAPFARAYSAIVAAIAAFHLLLATALCLAGAATGFALVPCLNVGLGVFLMVMGNFLPKVTRNRLVGIRTRWTLASDMVWERTHRFAGPVLMATGAVLVLLNLLARPQVMASVAVLLVGSFVPVVYSFFISRDSR